MKNICTYHAGRDEFIITSHVGRYFVKQNGRLVMRASEELTARAYVDGFLEGNDQSSMFGMDETERLRMKVKELEVKLGIRS